MKRLKQINEIYESLLIVYSKKSQEVTNLSQDDVLQEFSQIKLNCNKQEKEFVKIAKQFGRENQLEDRVLVTKIINEIIKHPNSINYYLLILLMWDLGDQRENIFCLKSLENLIRNMLDTPKISYSKEYYLESFIDIWNYDTDQLIPVDILQKIILIDLENRYGAMIKAVAYLSDHPKDDRERVLSEVRLTKKYQEDEYYQEWID